MKTIPSLRRHHYVAAISIFLIGVALIAGMAGCIRGRHGIEIRDWYGLDAIRNELAEDYVLMNDLDSTTAGYKELASPTANEGKGWEPIGGEEFGDVFRGSFDGNGHKICDLFINRPNEKNVALFGWVGSVLWIGAIKNVGVVDFTVTGNVNVAGLVAASLMASSVTNCYATGSVTGSDWVGGLVGFISEGGTVTSSYFTGSVSGDTYVGGLMGSNDGGTVLNCYATGSVNGSDLVGGLVGRNWGTVSNSYSTPDVAGSNNAIGGLVGASNGTVSKSYSTGSVTGGGEVGGLVGDDHGSVTNCYATGNVTGRTGSDWVGGLVGDAYNVSDSYATGSVTGSHYVGGLAGHAHNVSNCYATGNVTGDDAIGGLVGWHDHGTVSYSYFIGSVAGNYSGGLVGVNGANWVAQDTLGLNDNDSVAIYYSYSTGSVTGSDCVGGLVGWNAGNVSDSYAAGSVAGNSSVGGLVADNQGGAVSDSFWDTEISGQVGSAGGTGKNTSEMKDIDTFSGATWSITTVANPDGRIPSYIWNIVDNETYPFLSWQPVF